ncbi:hypothetical protein ACIA5D_38085 [Actinoplanes sp. NPDC051513]|uniref:hypothetical protein n=1 Tax=Actinoplanes sp. NPDC051513 TaxID=3363908 RepID=UPI0037B4D844
MPKPQTSKKALTRRRLLTASAGAAAALGAAGFPILQTGSPAISHGKLRAEPLIPAARNRGIIFEMDVYWAYVARFKHQSYVDQWGRTRTDLFDPILTVAPRTERFPLFHAKDGDRAPEQSNGHVMVPLGEGDLNFQQFFEEIGEQNYHHANWEQDNAPGGAANPGQSLSFAELSYRNMSELTIYRR